MKMLRKCRNVHKCSDAARESISNIYTWTGSQSIARSAELVKAVMILDVCRDVTQPAKIRVRQIRILCFKSVGCRCVFATQSQLVPLSKVTITRKDIPHNARFRVSLGHYYLLYSPSHSLQK